MKIDLREKPEQKPQLTFGDVRDDQLFVKDGDLCLKQDTKSYFVLTDGYGDLCSFREGDASPDMPIERILTHITGFEF